MRIRRDDITMNSNTIELKLNGINGAAALLVRRWAGAGDPVLYIHGATFPSALSIGYRFEGRSWADHLHAQGFDVWGFDFAGFGGSPPYRQMREPANLNGPLGRTRDAIPQIAAVVEHIVREAGRERVHLVAHSWGTMAAGGYAGMHPERVGRFVMFGPIVQRSMIGFPDAEGIGAWRHLSVAEQLARFVEDVPADHPPVLIEPDLALWGPAWLGTDPEAATRSPHAVKVPNGPLADNIAALSGQLAYDPARVTVPTLIARGAWDNLCQDDDAAWLMRRLGAETKADVVIPAATHLMHLERGRDGLFAATADWLAAR
jgi:pimeloyl-ACP methyl ester carboxylesterase